MTGSMLKILFVVHNQTRKGGAYYRGVTLGAPLARRGHDVTLLSIHPDNKLLAVVQHLDGVRVIESPDWLSGSARTGWDPFGTAWRLIWLLRQRFDIIHTVDTRPAVCLPVIAARRSAGALWVADWTDWWGRGGAIYERSGGLAQRLLAPIEQFFEEQPRKLADANIVISNALRTRARELGLDDRTMLYLPPGTDPDAIRTTSISQARRELALDQSAFLVGYLGNIYQRDANLLFTAVNHVKSAPLKLVMVGEPGCQIPPGLNSMVIKTGRLPYEEMLKFLSACNVLALPLTDTVANRGRWPSKLNEYVAVGRPIVASDVGDVANLFRNFQIGMLVAPDPTAFGSAVDCLLQDSRLADELGNNARELARNEYSQRAVADRLEDFYKELLIKTLSRKVNDQ